MDLQGQVYLVTHVCVHTHTLQFTLYVMLKIISCSCFLLPASNANRIKRLQRNFLSGGVGEEQNFHLENWSKVCSLMLAQGLGAQQLIPFNYAILGSGRYANETRKLLEGGDCNEIQYIE